jgi:hypothetical protein
VTVEQRRDRHARRVTPGPAVPEAEGPLVLDLELRLPAGEVVTNRYEASIDAA